MKRLLGVTALGLACALAHADEWLVSMAARGCVREAPVWLVLDDAFRFARWPTHEIDEASELARFLDRRSPHVEHALHMLDGFDGFEARFDFDVDPAAQWIYVTELDPRSRTSIVSRVALDSARVERLTSDCIEKHIAMSRDGRRELVARRDAARRCRTELVIRDLELRIERLVPLCADVVEWPSAEFFVELDPALGARWSIRSGAWSADEHTAALIVWSGGGFTGRSRLVRVDLTTGTVRERPLDASRSVATVRSLTGE